jgi:hypothetical protein
MSFSFKGINTQNVNVPIGVFSRSFFCNFSVLEHAPSFLLGCEDEKRTTETNKGTKTH